MIAADSCDEFQPSAMDFLSPAFQLRVAVFPNPIRILKIFHSPKSIRPLILTSLDLSKTILPDENGIKFSSKLAVRVETAFQWGASGSLRPCNFERS